MKIMMLYPKVKKFITLGFLSSIKFTYINKELHQDQDLSGFTLFKALESFESQDRTLNHDLYFIGVIEYTHPTLKEKYFFNVFFRANIIADIKWIEVFMYDITLNQRIEAIDQTIKLKEKILSKIAHEFKTPLICVISLSEKIKNQLKCFSSNQDLRSEIKQINDLSNYTLLLINDIAFYLNTNSKSLDGVLSNINNSKFYKKPTDENTDYSRIILHREDVNIIDILRFVYRILETLLIYKGNPNIKPLKEFQSNVFDLIINTDPLRLKQILLNLVSNAVKFTKSGYIKLSAKINTDEKFNRELVISVEDTGLGIKEEDYDKLFKDFKMIEGHQNLNTMGTGLGLSISSQLAKLLGYENKVESKYTIGTTFSITIKLHNLQYTTPREKSCPIWAEGTKLKLDNYARLTENNNIINVSNNAINVIDLGKKNIKRLLSGPKNHTITNQISRRKQRSKDYLPVTSIVHIYNSNINLNNYNNKGGLNVIDNTDHYSSSEEKEEIKSKTETDKTEEGLFPVNMNEVRKQLMNFSSNSDKDNRVQIYKPLPLQSTKSNKMSSKIHSEKSVVKNIIINYTTGIVIVDDNAMLLSSLNNVIKKDLVNNNINNVKIFSGSDGIDLLKIIIDDQKGPNIIKCVFVDEFMEFMNGTEVIKIIREYERSNKIKPLFITKVSAMHFEQNSDGANITLEKPVRDKQIQKVLKLAGIICENDLSI
jgi:signal transduction histidine kinase/CheY-like chemotaxis protein